MQTKEDFQKQAIKEVISSDYVKYALYGVGAVIAIYLSGIVMKVIGNTTHSYKYMQEAFKK